MKTLVSAPRMADIVNAMGKKIVYILIVTVLCMNITFVYAEKTMYYIAEDYNNYATYSQPEKCEISASRYYIAENENKDNKYLVLEGNNSEISLSYTVDANLDSLYYSVDLSPSKGNMAIDIIITGSNGKKFKAVIITAENKVLTYDGKNIGGVSSSQTTNIAVLFNAKYSRYTIFINGDKKVSDWYVKSGYPSNNIKSVSVSSLAEGETELRIDNFYVYTADNLIKSKSLKSNTYNPDSVELSSNEVVETEEDDSIMWYSNFDGDYKANLGTTFQTYPYSNSIESIYDKRNDNQYIKMYKNTNDDCHIQLFLGSKQRAVVQMDLKSDRLSSLSFLGIDNAKNNTVFMSISEGKLFSNGISIGSISNRKWTTVTLAVDNQRKVISFYVDGKLMAKNVPMASNDLDDFSILRISLGPGAQEKDLMLDNIIAYNGTTYRDYSTMLSGIIDENITIYDLKEKQVMSALNGYNAVNVKSGYVYADGERVMSNAVPYYNNENLMVSEIDAAKLLSAEKIEVNFENNIVTVNDKQYALENSAEEKDGNHYIPLNEIAKACNKTVTDCGIGTVIVGDTECNINDTIMWHVNAYMLYARPEKDEISQLFINERPRVILNNEKIEVIKAEYGKNKYITKWGQDIIAKADAVIDLPAQTYYKYDGLRLLPVSTEVRYRVSNLALSYYFTDDTKYVDRAWKEIEAVCNFKDWNQGVHSLDAASMASAVAIGYDWLYKHWDSSQKEIMEKALYDFQLDLAYQTYHGARKIDYGWATVGNNWNAQCNGQIILAASAVFETNPDKYSDIIKNALRCLENCLKGFYPSGAWGEGTGYWNHTVESIGTASTTLNNTFGTNFNITKTPSLDITADYVVSSVGPNGPNNYNDNGAAESTMPTMFWFSNIYNNPELTKVRLYHIDNEKIEGRYLDICYYNTEISNKDIDMPLDSYFEGIELVNMRSSFTSPTATFISYHSGDNMEGKYHSHIDSGTFVLDMIGERFAYDLGVQDYNSPGMNTLNPEADKITRWSYYQLSPEGHNCLLINPDDSAGQKIYSSDKVECLVSKERGAYSITELSDAYEEYASSVRRGFMLSDDRRSVLIRDEIDLIESSNEVYWFMHCKSDTEIEFIDKNTAIMNSNGKKVKLMFLTNAATSEMSEMRASHLKREVPSEQYALNDYKKIAIKLTGSGKMYIAVKIIPYDDPAANNPIENVALDDWTIPDGELVELPFAKSVMADGSEIAEFDPKNVTYTVKVPFGADKTPEITAECVEGTYAQVIQNRSSIKDVTLIKIHKSDNPEIYRTYYVNYETDMSSIDKYRIKPADVEVSETPEPENVGSNVYDGNLNTRWSAEGDDQWLIMDFGESKYIDYIGIAFLNGNARTTNYKLYISKDAEDWELIHDGDSSGKTIDIELSEKIGKDVRYIKFVGYGNSKNKWNSITELAAYGINK